MEKQTNISDTQTFLARNNRERGTSNFVVYRPGVCFILSLGAASTLAAAQTIYLLPVALIATSIAATELPELSRLEQPFAIQQRVSKRLTQMLWILAPVMAIYIGAGTHIADVLFNLGGFRERISSEDLKLLA